jgi:hypothetical protein
MKLIDKITLPFYRIRNAFRDAYYNLKYRCQRFVRGYADEDIWNIDCWFIENMKKIFPEFIKRTSSHPTELTWEEWKELLDTMNDLLHKMDIDDVAAVVFKKESYELSETDVRIAKEMANRNRKLFFYAFNQYFDHLWY